MVRALIFIALASACTRTSEKYCGLHPDDLANCPRSDAAIDARPTCSTDDQCAPPAKRCFIPSTGPGMCVGCLDNADCTEAGMQACDPETLTCRSCLVHADCASNACLPDGTCGTDANTIFVTAGATATAGCTAASPCGSIEDGLAEIDPMTRYHLKLSGSFAGPLAIAGKRAVILADPQTIVQGGDPTLKLQKSTVRIHDLEVSGVNCIRSEMLSTLFLEGVYVHDCSKVGVEAKDGFISITRSRVTTSLDGGILLLAPTTFEITNTMVYKNGDDAAPRGGVTIGATTTGNSNRFEHNTIADNRMKYAATTAAGVTCTATNFLVLRNNIIAGNTTTTGVNNNFVPTGGCDVMASLVADDTAPIAFTADYHVAATSTAIDKVESTIAEDFDGEFRPQGAQKDYGADEHKP